ncbi:MAG TPA: ABC transporter substrate-binding protein [candidate division Zixibacteria bacterium]|nr:ABC transporter substrate-binding protein [candidate division Zixibacteria bacterium]
MNKRAWLCFWLLLLIVLTAPQSAQAQGGARKKIHVGVPAVSMGNMIIFFAKEAGIYEKHGLDAEVVVMQGSGIASRALVAGSVAISPIATPTVMNAVLAGSDMVILAHTMPGVVQSLMVRPDIKRTEDLKGKRVGVTTFGSLTDFLVRHVAKKKGLNPDREFALLQIGGDAERLLALKQGKVDAAALSHPAYILAQRAGFVQFWDFFKEVDYPWSEIATTRKQIERDRDLVTRYMRAHIEGIARFKQEPEFAKRVIKKVLRLDDDSLANESWELFAKHRLAAPYPNLKGMKTSYEYVAATRPDVWKHKPEEFADASFVTELDKSGFIKKLYER